MDLRDKTLFEPPEIGCILSLTGLSGGSSKIYDRSPYGNIGAITGATWNRLPGGLWCLSFDGVDDYITLPTVTHLTFADTDPWTFESWLKWNGDPGGDYLAYAGMSSGTETFMLKYAGNNHFVLRARDNLYYHFAVGSSDAIVDKWTHVVWIADGADNLTIYLDGKFLETITSTPTQMHFNHIGRGEASNRWAYGGLIALSRVHNRALVALEIQNHFQREKHLFGVW